MSDYDRDPLLYNLEREEKIRQLVRRKHIAERYIHPSLQSLSENESNILRVINSKYDREGGSYINSYTPNEQNIIKTLRGLGFVYITKTNRIIPSYVFQEHGKRRDFVKIGDKEFKI